MSGRRGGRGRRGRARGTSRSESAQTAVLRDIRSELTAQSIHAMPLVRDVRPMSLARDRTCMFTGSYSLPALNAPSVDYAIGYAVALNSVPGYSELTQVFDQYRIMQLIFQFEPARNPLNVQDTGGVTYTAIDYDDTNSPGTAAELMQYDTCMTVPTGIYFRRVVNPRIAYAAYGSGAFTSYANERAGWIDAASSGVAHYGLKLYMTAGVSANMTAYRPTVQVFMQFRSQH